MKVAVLNQSSAPNEAVGKIAQALRIYGRMVARAWGLTVPAVEFMPGMTVAPDGWVPAIAADHPDVTGALGYHDVDPRGRPYMRNFLDVVPGKTLLHDPSGHGASLAGVFSHELAEAMVDATANLWAQGIVMDGKVGHSLVALEVADPVQDYAFPIALPDGTVVDASDFVLPDYFNPPKKSDPAPVDYMRKLADPFTVAPGGYLIVADVTADGQVFGARKVLHDAEPPPAWRETIKGHPASRTARRSAR